MGIPEDTALSLFADLSGEAAKNIETAIEQSTETPDPELLRSRIKGDITGRALNADIKLLQSTSASSLVPILSKVPREHVSDLLQLLQPRHQCIGWSDEVVVAARCFHGSELCLEVVGDIKRVDPGLNHRLSQTPGLIVGAPAHDVGPFPRIYVQAADPHKRSTVSKARWTTLTRVICGALLVLNHPNN